MRRRRIALWVWYRGDRFLGWQSQGTGRSVQETLAAALEIQGRPMASGRTDRGVHARCQPVSVRLPADIAPASLLSLGAEDWGIAAAVAAPDGFHAQWSSTAKEYRYRLATGPVGAAWSGLAWDPQTHPRLAGRRVEPGRVREALERAVGTRDFSALHAASSVRRPRTLQGISWMERGGLVEIGLRGDGFGRHGVRLLVGGAVLVGAGLVDAGTWARALDAATAFDGLRAPAGALTLWAVDYPAGLDPFSAVEPAIPRKPPFLPVDQA